MQASGRGAWDAAERAFARAAAAAPGDLLMWLNLANARRHLRDVEGAWAAVEQCLGIDVNHAVARALAAEVLVERMLREGSEPSALLAAMTPVLRGDARLLTAVGYSLWAAQRPLDAVHVLLAAVVAAPARPNAHEMLMYCMRDLGLKREATECAKTVLALQPDHPSVRMHMLFDQRGACDWTDLQLLCDELSAAVEATPPDACIPLSVFSLLSVQVDPAVRLKAARIAAQSAVQDSKPLPRLWPSHRRAGPLRIGFLSYDFRNHPVAQLLAEVFERLDRQRCSVHLYSHGPDDGSPWRARVAASADRFVACADHGDALIARCIRDDGIDVLLELGGHTRGSRLGVLGCRPAPVQVSLLGYPGTTGMQAVDYLIGDAIVTPLAHAAQYSEKLAQLSGCVLPASAHRPLPQAMQRTEHGLAQDAFVMCAFNQAYKILPEALDIWCEVMRDVPHAVLWLKAPNDDAVANLRREAQQRGVAPQRLVFATDKIDYGDHFSRLALADVFVDNWPYNAHTTASDALWSGLPVLTVRGESFAARVAASLLATAGLDDLVCEGVQSYRRRLLALARDPAPLRAARERLVRGRAQSPLFDSDAWADDLLALVERMHARWMQGLPPEHLPGPGSSSAA
jgi:predicted O-linked N-acetylglucosamine transferase (SPINDLY family)